MLCDGSVWLAECPDTHVARIRLHFVQQERNLSGIPLPAAVEAKVVDVKTDELQLCLEVVPEADHFVTAFLVPFIRHPFQVVRRKVALVELFADVHIEGCREVELELTVQEALLPGIQ